MAVATPIYAGRNETRHQTLLRELVKLLENLSNGINIGKLQGVGAPQPKYYTYTGVGVCLLENLGPEELRESKQ